MQETLERARRDTQLCNASVALAFGVLKDALNGQGRLTRSAVHRCVRQLREPARNSDRRGETEGLADGKGVADESRHNSAAAEDVLDRLFDAFEVHDSGEVDFFEFASALSVSWREQKCPRDAALVVVELLYTQSVVNSMACTLLLSRASTTIRRLIFRFPPYSCSGYVCLCCSIRRPSCTTGKNACLGSVAFRHRG